MGQQQIEALAERLTNDPQFRSEFQTDPEAAAASIGIELDDSDREALRSEDWAQVADQELATRVSKGRSWA
jgi:putative modified peptide